jgi:hypothetical protein
MYATSTNMRKTKRIHKMKYYIEVPNATLPTSPKVFAPVILAQRQRRYSDLSVMTAARNINRDPRTIPHFSNARGRDNTPPPIIVAERLNVATHKFDLRSGESNAGTSVSELIV